MEIIYGKYQYNVFVMNSMNQMSKSFHIHINMNQQKGGYKDRYKFFQKTMLIENI